MLFRSQRTGFPIDNLPLIVGLALYGKELLAKQDEPTGKTEIISYLERYDRFVKETKEKDKTEENTVFEDGDDEE